MLLTRRFVRKRRRICALYTIPFGFPHRFSVENSRLRQAPPGAPFCRIDVQTQPNERGALQYTISWTMCRPARPRNIFTRATEVGLAGSGGDVRIRPCSTATAPGHAPGHTGRTDFAPRSSPATACDNPARSSTPSRGQGTETQNDWIEYVSAQKQCNALVGAAH